MNRANSLKLKENLSQSENVLHAAKSSILPHNLQEENLSTYVSLYVSSRRSVIRLGALGQS